MRYDTARPLIDSGDVIAFSHDGWSTRQDVESQLVRIFTRSEYSHVALAWVVGGRVFIIESVVPAVRIYPLSKVVPFYWIAMHSPFSSEAEEYALSRVGEPYSKWEAIKGFVGRNSDNGRWECAELVKSVLSKNGIDLPGKATPTHVVRDAMAIGTQLILVQ